MYRVDQVQLAMKLISYPQVSGRHHKGEEDGDRDDLHGRREPAEAGARPGHRGAVPGHRPGAQEIQVSLIFSFLFMQGFLHMAIFSWFRYTIVTIVSVPPTT